MAKRGGSSSAQQMLTGGTKDVNPQFLQGRVTLSAANTATEVTLGTPIVRVGPQTNGKSIIMEVLKVYLQLPDIDLDAAAATSRVFSISMGTVSRATSTPVVAVLDDPRTFLAVVKTIRNAFTAAGTGMLDDSTDPVVVDLTDGAGHGILIATDNIFIQANTTNQTAANAFAFKILYRFKEVSLVEYIGIVQSQQ